jgi:transposase
MGDFSDFQRGQIVGVYLAGVPVNKTDTLLGVSRAAISNVMMAYTNGKTSSAKRYSGQKPKNLSERDRHTLERTVSENHRLLQQR